MCTLMLHLQSEQLHCPGQDYTLGPSEITTKFILSGNLCEVLGHINTQYPHREIMIITHNNRNRGLFQKINIIHYSQNETELKASATRKEVLLWFAYTLSTSQNFWKVSSLLSDWSNRETD